MTKPLDLPTALKRGFLERCPTCGEGKLYRKYLKVQDCPECGAANTVHPADDLPAYATILLVGHLVIAPLLIFPFVWTWSPAAVLAVTLVPLTMLVLALLPRIKGAVIGLHTVLARNRAVRDTAAGVPPLA